MPLHLPVQMTFEVKPHILSHLALIPHTMPQRHLLLSIFKIISSPVCLLALVGMPLCHLALYLSHALAVRPPRLCLSSVTRTVSQVLRSLLRASSVDALVALFCCLKNADFFPFILPYSTFPCFHGKATFCISRLTFSFLLDPSLGHML